ncbi:MAG TPA: bifunctional phosphopantothenoylcysteine decarboxylase/phosphopantothenate--cysteine ligase CoaBC [Labilithrix sp.]|nr:bifunctional phosphopantothenoylcysteine decarboxylase/phosphopantothenate--cysteine ligase CoaBC [Labilithrix sp.]
MSSLAGRTIALAVTGSIAAYKAVEVARLCIKAGATVLPLMTTSAQRFVGPVTLAGITGEPVATEMWDPAFPGEMHVSIAARADLLVIVPATADLLARLAQGRADDLLTATALCARGPVLAAPAMHPRMWLHPATQRNVAELARQGRVTLIGPVDGPVASGESGIGRMVEPAELVAAIARALAGAQDLAGRSIVVTAGPTHEALDPVRYLGNRSSGRMGFAIAARARARGAAVTLIAGPVALATPSGVERVDVESALEMQRALEAALGPDQARADALVMAAAVADFRALHSSAAKIKKGEGAPVLALATNPDLLAAVGARRTGARPFLVGFALETGDDASVLAYATAKLVAKKVDLVVANAAHESLGHTTNRVALVGHDGAEPFEVGTKEAVADRILDAVARALAKVAPSRAPGDGL